jgi:hypothetical protein
MLGTIENMKFFLRTGFGNSTSFTRGGIRIKTQGICQGNGALPAGWVVISVCLLDTHGRKGHGANSSARSRSWNLSAILYVDNTDILHIDLKKVFFLAGLLPGKSLQAKSGTGILSGVIPLGYPDGIWQKD